MEETTLDAVDQQKPKKRPVFITVLCILTWVGSGIALIQSLVGLASNPTAELEEFKNTPGADVVFEQGFLDDFIFWSNISNWVAILVSIMCIVGAILMFQLKKNGFYLYVAGCVISAVVSFMAISYLMPKEFAWIGQIAVVFSVLISVAFIIMYAVNLKHMK